MSSLENISTESVTCLAFADSYTKKSGLYSYCFGNDLNGKSIFSPKFVFIIFFCVFVDPMSLLPTLWVGTSLGSVLTVSIILPEADGRKTQPVLVSILGKFSN